MLQIGIYLEHENFDNREAFRGICEFVRRYELGWRLIVLGRWQESPESYKALAGGIVATHDKATRKFFHDAGLPVVSLSPRFVDEWLPQIWHDELAIGQLAVDHLLQRGYRRFGWFGDESSATSEKRQQSFCEALAARGFGLADLAVNANTWESDDAKLLEAALQDDPHPIGCFAVEDRRGLKVVDACLDAGIQIPRRVGVIGVNNAAYICEACFPPLTSIELDMKGRGIEAARLLARQLDGQALTVPPPLVPPVRLVARESTGFASTGDPMVDKAIAFIHANARRDVSIDDVVRHANTNRRTLSWKFARVLNTTPHRRIMEARIEVIKDLLLTTDLNTEALTEAAGFVSRSHMSRIFREATGMTLVEYRKKESCRVC